MTPRVVTPLVDNGTSLGEALTRIECCMGDQSEQMSIRMSELERELHVERESLRWEINRSRQEVSRRKSASPGACPE